MKRRTIVFREEWRREGYESDARKARLFKKDDLKLPLIGCMLLVVQLQVYSEGIYAKASKQTSFYGDYEQRIEIGRIPKDAFVRIEGNREAHDEDPNYWGFDVLINDASIRIEYEGQKGYVSFRALRSTEDLGARSLRGFSGKVVVPTSYCDTLYHLDSRYLEKDDPFFNKYEQYIKYFFDTDIHQEWYYNYPISCSFINDLFFQISAIPGRYNFTGFITDISKGSFTCIVGTNIDQFRLFDFTTSYEGEAKYCFTYTLDGDYIAIYDKGRMVFSGVGVEKETWEYAYNFMKRRLMKSAEKQAESDEYFSRGNMEEIAWPRHADGSCDYPGAGKGKSW